MKLNHYSRAERLIDTLGIVAFFGLELYLLRLVIPSLGVHPLLSLMLVVLGYIAADVTSGMIHWAGDTWGHAGIPIVGRAFIGPFREHHVDQTAITRHDFVETNGHNCVGSAVILFITILVCIWIGFSTLVHLFLTFVLSLTLSIFATNQFHKWAHSQRVPRLIAWLQNKRIILSPTHHVIHHTSPFERSYCITVGWMNPILDKLHFFRILEKMISSITKAVPRTNDGHLNGFSSAP